MVGRVVYGMQWKEHPQRCVVNALLARHKKLVWVTWLVAALMFLAVGNGLVYGLAIPLTAGLLVLIAPD